jgi:hypothetical protein
MDWILAGFGFAFGMWLFALALRWAAPRAGLLFSTAKWLAIGATLLAAVVVAFAWSEPAGIIAGAGAAVGFAWFALKALPPVTSPSREP